MTEKCGDQDVVWRDERWERWGEQVAALGYAQARAEFLRHWTHPQLLWEFARRFDPQVRASGPTTQRPDPWPPSSPAPLTPYELGVLLRHHGQAFGLYHAPTKDPILEKLLTLGLLELAETDASQRRLSPKGAAYLDSLLRVPLPEAVWVTTWPTK